MAKKCKNMAYFENFVDKDSKNMASKYNAVLLQLLHWRIMHYTCMTR